MFPELVHTPTMSASPCCSPTSPALKFSMKKVWIDAPPVKNAAGEEAFVINIGDMLEVLSAGTFVATAHRVRKVPQERYSFRCSPAITTR